MLILGKGFIGQKMQKAFDCLICDNKLNSFEDFDRELEKYNPETVINCIGCTGKNNVDGCEEDKDNTLFLNSFIPIILAEACLRRNINLVHISSGCIYHYDYAKDTPLTEEAFPDFFHLFYSRSKIYSEAALKSLAREYNILIVRIRIPLDDVPCSKNILTKIISFKRVIDVPNSITYIPDFINALKHLIKIKACGIYNIVNKGGLRYSELLEIYKKYKPDFKYKIIEHSKLSLVRTNLLLSVDKLEKTGFIMPDIHEVLEPCVKNYLNYS